MFKVVQVLGNITYLNGHEGAVSSTQSPVKFTDGENGHPVI